MVENDRQGMGEEEGGKKRFHRFPFHLSPCLPAGREAATLYWVGSGGDDGMNLVNFEKAFFEIESNVEMFQKIEPEQTFDWAFGRKRMTEHLKVSDFFSKSDKSRNRYHGTEDSTASRGNFFNIFRTSRINSDVQNRIRRDDGECSSGVQSDSDEKGALSLLDLSTVNDEPFVKDKFSADSSHLDGLQSGFVSFGEFARGAFNEDIARVLYAPEFLVNDVPMRAVSKKLTRQRGSRRLIHFKNTDQKPLTIAFVFLFDGFDVLSFHSKESISQGSVWVKG
jgi:hypothetical protein